MRTTITKVAAGVATLAIASVALLASSAAALPPGTPANGAATVSPLTGNSATSITLLPPSGAVCPGDSASGGYKWQTFMVASSVDPATLTYNASGPVSGGAAFTQPMFAAGTPVINKNTAVTTGLITGIPAVAMNVFAPGFVPAGAYTVGFACTLAGATVSYWTAPITITTNAAGGPAQIDYAYGAVPAAPVLGGTLTAGDQTLAGTFTHSTSVPATTSYTVTAVPTAGPTVTLPLAAGATSFTLTGLVNGTSYAVSLIATNSVGGSAVSNVVSGTPNPGARPAVTGLAAVPGTGAVTLNWVTPTGVAPTGYTIAVSPVVAGSPFTAAAGATTFDVTGLTAGTNYTYTVTPTHPAPYVGTSASVSAVPLAAQNIIQDVTVVRPAGALVLTQRCGVYGALPIEPASPGFASLPAELASADQVGTAPLNSAGLPDPQFVNYPSPSSPTYPTRCGLDLGTSQLVTSGPLAGQYYTASGRLNQVTVSDTRDTDTGWTVNGTMSDFVVAGGGSSFSGNYLGWTPVVTDDSDATSAGYDQTVVAGAPVLPDTAAGLATPKVLSSAASGAGLGIAKFDARVKLLIPVSARSGTYAGTLTFTVI
ncbi:MAG: fibronectin type III domain-containing protein [Actinomycetota bacterium]|nr:fibronectin type III domain-containing protein [Actinomycetota bacterium]